MTGEQWNATCANPNIDPMAEYLDGVWMWARIRRLERELGILGDDAGYTLVEARDGAAVRLRDLVMESGLDAEVHAGSMYGVNAPIVRASAAEGRVVVEVPALEGATA